MSSVSIHVTEEASDSRVLLVGAGADIGSNLLILAATSTRKHRITDVLTRPIESEGIDSGFRTSLDELRTRVVLAQPHLFDSTSVDHGNSLLTIAGKSFRIHFQDFNDDLTPLGRFDLAILATSRSHVRSDKQLARLEAIADTVLGVAENGDIPAIYPALATSNPAQFSHARNLGSRPKGSFALGSCQCAGWTAGLRVLANFCEERNSRLADVLLHSEVDIVHPDTASSNFGTTRIGARTEDARDNLRPGVSQVSESMNRFKPATTYNSVSLRVLTQPPGYQVQRFVLETSEVDENDIRRCAKSFSSIEPSQLLISETPIGSRAFSATPSSTILVDTTRHLSVQRFAGVSEVIVQAYVHNTIGYCAAVLTAVDHCLSGNDVTGFEPAGTNVDAQPISERP